MSEYKKILPDKVFTATAGPVGDFEPVSIGQDEPGKMADVEDLGPSAIVEGFKDPVIFCRVLCRLILNFYEGVAMPGPMGGSRSHESANNLLQLREAAESFLLWYGTGERQDMGGIFPKPAFVGVLDFLDHLKELRADAEGLSNGQRDSFQSGRVKAFDEAIRYIEEHTVSKPAIEAAAEICQCSLPDIADVDLRLTDYGRRRWIHKACDKEIVGVDYETDESK